MKIEMHSIYLSYPNMKVTLSEHTRIGTSSVATVAG